MNFQQRSYQKELLDDKHIPFKDIEMNMRELDVINHRLGGHGVTLKGIKQLTGAGNMCTISIVEIGCGGGDNLRAIKKWAAKNQIQVTLKGVDINPDCIEFARSKRENDGIEFYCSDYRHMLFTEKPHIIFNSLFCHHFTDDELTEMLQWMQQRSKVGFFINDLHRHPLAYYSIRLLTKGFSKSYLVRNDAPLSVLRSFKKKDWKYIFDKANITNYSCSWQWAFRWLIIYKNNEAN